jgi:type III restriction enzyme
VTLRCARSLGRRCSRVVAIPRWEVQRTAIRADQAVTAAGTRPKKGLLSGPPLRRGAVSRRRITAPHLSHRLTDAFEDFVRSLEGEGVHVPTERQPPRPPITVVPIPERIEYDIEIPRTRPSLERSYKRVQDFDPTTADSIFDVGDIGRLRALRMKAEDAVHKISLGVVTVERLRPPLTSEVVASITNRIQRAAGLTLEFSVLAPRAQRYLEERCFGEPVDLESEVNRIFLGEPEVQEQIARVLAARLGELVTEIKPITVEPEPIRLSDTKAFHWRRQHTVCEKTVFNYVATFNAFETEFAEFLETCEDVSRFAALAEFFTVTGFWVDYVKPSGATGRYFPDWVVVQKLDEGEANWIVETKGRVWEGTDRKDWCTQVTESTGESWRYLRVDQPMFKPEDALSFGGLAAAVEAHTDDHKHQLIVVPGERS